MRFMHKRPYCGAACAAAKNLVTSDFSFYITTRTQYLIPIAAACFVIPNTYRRGLFRDPMMFLPLFHHVSALIPTDP